MQKFNADNPIFPHVCQWKKILAIWTLAVFIGILCISSEEETPAVVTNLILVSRRFRPRFPCYKLPDVVGGGGRGQMVTIPETFPSCVNRLRYNGWRGRQPARATFGDKRFFFKFFFFINAGCTLFYF